MLIDVSKWFNGDTFVNPDAIVNVFIPDNEASLSFFVNFYGRSLLSKEYKTKQELIYYMNEFIKKLEE